MGKHAGVHQGDYGPTDYGAGAPPEVADWNGGYEPEGGQWGNDQRSGGGTK